MPSPRETTDQPLHRLDKWLVDHGLAQSRARAKAMIEEGKVRVLGCPVPRPETLVAPTAEVTLADEDIPWVSRGGLKLEAALTHWNVDVHGLVCLDIGASTGGFTDVLLRRGARRVYALDVGHGQIADRLRSDQRVINLEGVNARDIPAGLLPPEVDFICVDVAFISLRLVLPPLAALLARRGLLVALVKPQFEVGKAAIGKGVVRNAAEHERVLKDVRSFARAVHLEEVGTIPSPIAGRAGNREFLMCLRKMATLAA